MVDKILPKWILVVSALFALMEIGVSVSMVFAPDSVLETVDLNARGVLYVVYMWAARQFALGFVIAYATIRRSGAMLTISYLFLLVMFVGDLAVGLVQAENGLIFTAIFMSLVSAGMLFAINRSARAIAVA